MKGHFTSMKKFLLLCVALTLLITGCSNNAYISLPTPTAIPISSFLLQSGDHPTPTPFQPIAPTPTKTMTAVPTEIPTSTPVPTAMVAQFPTSNVAEAPNASGRVNILILGSDYRAGRGFRTDVIMLLSINTANQSVTLTSFPRDLYVSIPGIGMERINTAQEYGGFELTTATFQQNFGVTPNYYVMTNFDGFKGIIDTLGGIDVEAATTLKDTCSVRSQEDGMGYCTVPAGTYHMDGEMALWYVRSRHSSSDFDRTRRAQEVITALFKKIVSEDGLNRATELYNLFKLNVETNIPLSEIATLLPVASKVAGDTSIIHRYAIGSSETYNYITASGAMVLVPDQTAVLSIIQQALSQ